MKAPKVGELRHDRGGITRERNAEEHLQRRRRRLRARAKVPRVPRVPRALQQLARPVKRPRVAVEEERRDGDQMDFDSIDLEPIA